MQEIEKILCSNFALIVTLQVEEISPSTLQCKELGAIRVLVLWNMNIISLFPVPSPPPPKKPPKNKNNKTNLPSPALQFMFKIMHWVEHPNSEDL